MSTRKTTLFDSKLTPVITETPDSVSIGKSNSVPSSSPSLSSEPSSGFNIKESITNLFSSSYTIYILFFLILAVLGINIFAYLGYFTDDTIGILKPLIFIGITTTSDISQDIISNSAEGTKAATDIVAGTVNSAIDTTGNVLIQSSDDDEKELEEESVDDYNKLQKDINEDNKPSNTVPEPDDVTSKTQKVKGKSGFCYIGEDRGFRSCIEVGENDACMSGDIFPTNEICINPSLREGTEKY